MEKDITEVLKYNRELQANLQKKIAAVEAAIARNINLQNKLKHLKNNQFSSETKTKDFGPPFFVDIYGNTPPKNDDIHLRERPKKFKPIKWIQQEKDALAQGVYDQNFRRECLKAMQSNQLLDTVLEKDSQYFLINVEGLDWCELSKQYVQNKTPEECIIQWTTHEHPSINKSEWTAAETRKLRQIASRHNNRNWQRIATELNTNRTAADCFKQWNKQTSGPRKWTKEEDEILARAVDLYGEKNWQQIAGCLENRSGQQCLHRWTKTMNPAIRRGRWKTEEDEALKNAVNMYGVGNWVKIQKFVLGRTDVQCRERWMNVLSPSVKKDPWTEEEDKELKRTDNQCWRRYKVLIKQDDEGESTTNTPSENESEKNLKGQHSS
ncbi:unnamed protein product [Rhizophagus irregularis]|nr:unnamed protein product [Rhizophagus irregularis]